MKKFIPLALSGAVFAPVLAFAGSFQLLPPVDGDLVASRLVIEKSAVPPVAERAPVDFAWALDPADVLARPAPYVAESREFWADLDAGQLRGGYSFQTTAPGALVRLSPMQQGKSRGLALSDLNLRINGEPVDAAQAVLNSADAQQMKAAGVDFNEGTIVFQLAPEAGIGTVEVMAKSAAGGYLLHVYEPDSPVTLSLGATRARLLAGDTLELSAKWLGASQVRMPASIGGLITAPDGYSKPIKLVRNKQGDYRASVVLPEDADGGLMLWEVHAFGVVQAKDGGVARDAKTSFSVSRPTARLGNQISLAKSRAMALGVEVEVGSVGRYELRGTLYGTDSSGALMPFAIAHSARWLEPGKASITLDFGELAAKAGMTGPFELRDLQLNDQARLGQLEDRARALRFSVE